MAAAVVRARHHVETGQSAEADVAEAQASVAATVPRAARLWTLGLPCAVCTAPARVAEALRARALPMTRAVA